MIHPGKTGLTSGGWPSLEIVEIRLLVIHDLAKHVHSISVTRDPVTRASTGIWEKLETTSTEILRLRDIQITGQLDPSKTTYSVSLPLYLAKL